MRSWKRVCFVFGLLTLLCCVGWRFVEDSLSVGCKVVTGSVFDPAWIRSVNESSWVLVDLDDCFFTSKSAWGSNRDFVAKVQRYSKKHPQLSIRQCIDDIYHYWEEAQGACKVRVVSDDLFKAIRVLQEKGITVIAVTHRWPCISKHTIRQLTELNFSFEKSSLIKGRHVFSEKIVFDSGILFCNDTYKKSNCLLRLFDYCSINKIKLPTNIIFFDDTLGNINDVRDLCNSQKINYLGVCFRGIDKFPSVYHPVIAKIQKQFHRQWKQNDYLIRFRDAFGKTKNSPKWVFLKKSIHNEK